MAKKCDTSFLTGRAGTSQAARWASALNPESFELQDLDVVEWLQLARDFAVHIQYYPIDNPDKPKGNWENFFPKGDLDTLKNFLAEAQLEQNLEPLLTLVVCFLKLMEFSRKRFNRLTSRHLEFYYAEILQIPRKKAQPDQVHLLFELAKNFTEAAVFKGSLVDAKKDPLNKPRLYATNADLIVNKGKVESLKSIYHEPALNVIKVAESTNTLDGVEKPLKENKSWWPFGYPETYDKRPPLANASLGLAISAPLLQLQEGNRNIAIRCTVAELHDLDFSLLRNHAKIYLTGEKGWLGPFTLRENASDNLPGTVVLSSSNPAVFNLAFTIPQEEKAVIPYNSELHGPDFETSHPLLKLMIDHDTAEAYEVAQSLSKPQLISLKLEVEVTGITSLKLENDLGAINTKKPFLPFGPRPYKRSHFKIDYPELFSKRWSAIGLQLSWLNLPESFRNHYEAYRSASNGYISSNLQYLNILYDFEELKVEKSAVRDLRELRDGVGASGIEKQLTENIQQKSYSLKNLIVNDASHFSVNLSLDNDETAVLDLASAPLFAEEDGKTLEESSLVVNTAAAQGQKPGSGPLELSLNNSFYHSLYPRLYTLAITSTENDVVIPNEPYTPFVEQLSLSYLAAQEISFVSGNVTTTPDVEAIELYHVHPFGTVATQNLFPSYDKGGRLYIGLKDAVAGQNISMLIQLLEGTENTSKPGFGLNEGISWSVLSGNEWLPLPETSILEDNTSNFLKTGIVRIAIPAEATTRHQLMPTGLLWLQAQTLKDYDVVCRFLDVRAQAVLAQFKDRDNALDHLENGLEAGTISKLINREAAIKKLEQPYSSFGGSPKENDAAYYRRVSERLRHKDRAVSLWDYEHLVLEHFKEVYKVKCLNHTCGNRFSAAGKVTVVVIPDIINQNVFDIFEPRVSAAKLRAIQEFLIGRTSFFVIPQVINPEYEAVHIALKARIKHGMDENYYLKKLEEDLKKFLSPWAYSETAKIVFSVELRQHTLVNYIEELDYVDFITDLVITHQGVEKKRVKPSNPKAILVSAKTHRVTRAPQYCAANTSNSIDSLC